MRYTRLILGVLLTVTPLLVSAQALDGEKLVTKVPFQFMVSGKVVPAGEYTVQSAFVGQNTLLIRERGGKTSLFSPASAIEARTAAGSDALVFNKYGDHYFLSAIKLEGNRTMYQLPESKSEADLREQNAPAVEQILVSSLK
jgi:hypothetical protein